MDHNSVRVQAPRGSGRTGTQRQEGTENSNSATSKRVRKYPLPAGVNSNAFRQRNSTSANAEADTRGYFQAAFESDGGDRHPVRISGPPHVIPRSLEEGMLKLSRIVFICFSIYLVSI